MLAFAQTDWAVIGIGATAISVVTAAVTAALVKLMPEWRLNKQLEQQIRQAANDQIAAGFKDLLKASEEDRKSKEEKLDEVTEELRKVMQAEARCHERADWLEKRVNVLEERERQRQEQEDQRRKRRQRPSNDSDEVPAIKLSDDYGEDESYGE